MRAAALHRVLGLSEEAYEKMLQRDRELGGNGVPVSLDPRMHAHPILDIIGHAHGTVEEARTVHVHRPVVEWDMTPIPVTVKEEA